MAKMLLPRKQGEKEVSAVKYTLNVLFVPGKFWDKTHVAFLCHTPPLMREADNCPL